MSSVSSPCLGSVNRLTWFQLLLIISINCLTGGDINTRNFTQLRHQFDSGGRGDYHWPRETTSGRSSPLLVMGPIAASTAVREARFPAGRASRSFPPLRPRHRRHPAEPVRQHGQGHPYAVGRDPLLLSGIVKCWCQPLSNSCFTVGVRVRVCVPESISPQVSTI